MEKTSPYQMTDKVLIIYETNQELVEFLIANDDTISSLDGVLVIGGGGSVSIAMVVIGILVGANVPIYPIVAFSSGVYYCITAFTNNAHLRVAQTHGGMGSIEVPSGGIAVLRSFNITMAAYEAMFIPGGMKKLMAFDEKHFFSKQKSFWNDVNPNDFWVDITDVVLAISGRHPSTPSIYSVSAIIDSIAGPKNVKAIVKGGPNV